MKRRQQRRLLRDLLWELGREIPKEGRGLALAEDGDHGEEEEDPSAGSCATITL